MKNLLNEKPQNKLNGRLLYTTKFVDSSDISNRSVLDIGCGFGWFELWSMEQNVKKIHGVEYSAESVTTARMNITNHRVSFEVASAIDLSQVKDTFDTVVSWEVIEHIPKLTECKMFEQVWEKLNNGGVFYLSTPFALNFKLLNFKTNA